VRRNGLHFEYSVVHEHCLEGEMSQGPRVTGARGDQPGGSLSPACGHLLPEGIPQDSGGSLLRLMSWLANCGLSPDAPPLIRSGRSGS
jgi:hypothetical protein